MWFTQPSIDLFTYIYRDRGREENGREMQSFLENNVEPNGVAEQMAAAEAEVWLTFEIGGGRETRNEISIVHFASDACIVIAADDIAEEFCESDKKYESTNASM